MRQKQRSKPNHKSKDMSEEEAFETVDDFLKKPVDSRSDNNLNLEQKHNFLTLGIQPSDKPYNWNATIKKISYQTLHQNKNSKRTKSLPAIAEREAKADDEALKKTTIEGVHDSRFSTPKIIYPLRKNEIPYIRKASVLQSLPKSMKPTKRYRR